MVTPYFSLQVIIYIFNNIYIRGLWRCFRRSEIQDSGSRITNIIFWVVILYRDETVFSTHFFLYFDGDYFLNIYVHCILWSNNDEYVFYGYVFTIF